MRRYMPRKGMRLRTVRGRIDSLDPNITIEFESSLVIVGSGLLDRNYHIGDDVFFDADELSQSEMLRYRGMKHEVKWRATKVKYIKPVEVTTPPSCDTVWKNGEIICIGEDYMMLRDQNSHILVDFSTQGHELGCDIGDMLQYDAVRLPIEKINLYYDTPKQSSHIARKIRQMPPTQNPSARLPQDSSCSNRLPTPSVIAPVIPSTSISDCFDDKKEESLPNSGLQEVLQVTHGKGTVMLIRPRLFVVLRFDTSAVIVPWSLISFSCDTDDIVEFSATPMPKAEKLLYTDTHLDSKWKATKVTFVKRADLIQGVGKIAIMDFGGEFCFLKDDVNGVMTDIFCTRINFKPDINRPNRISTYFKEGDLISYAAKEQATFGERNVKWKTVAATSPDFALYHVKSQLGTKWYARRIKCSAESSRDSQPNSGRNSPEPGGQPSETKKEKMTEAIKAEPFILGSVALQTSSENANSLYIENSNNSLAEFLSRSEDRDLNNNGGPPSSSECSIAEWSAASVPLHRSTPNSSFELVQPKSMEKKDDDYHRLQSDNHYADDANVSMENNTSTTFDNSYMDRSLQVTGSKLNNSTLEKIRNELVGDCLAVLRGFEIYPVPISKFLSEFLYLHRMEFQARLKPLGLHKFSQFEKFLTGNTCYFVVTRNGASDIFKKDYIAPTSSETQSPVDITVRSETANSSKSADRAMNFGRSHNQYPPQHQAHGVPLMPLPFPMGHPHRPPPFYHPAFDYSNYGGEVMNPRMQPLAIMPAPVSKYLKMDEFFTIVNEECANAVNGISVECLFEKVVDRSEPRNLQLNPIVAGDFPAVLKRAIASGSVHATFKDGMAYCSRLHNQLNSLDSSENGSSNRTSAWIDVVRPTISNPLPIQESSPEKNHRDEPNSGVPTFSKTENNQVSSDERKSRPSHRIESNISALSLEDPSAVSCSVPTCSAKKELDETSSIRRASEGPEKQNTSLSYCHASNLTEVPAVVDEHKRKDLDNQGSVARKTGGSFGFLRKNKIVCNETSRIVCNETSRKESNTSVQVNTSEQVDSLTLSKPVEDWMEHLRLKRGGTIFIQPKNKHQCSQIREAKAACNLKWEQVMKLPDLLMLLRMIEPSRKMCNDWQAILDDFKQYKLLPLEKVLIEQFGVSMEELFSCGFYERSDSAEDHGCIVLNRIIVPLNFIQIHTDSVVDFVYQLFRSQKNVHPLKIRDVVFAVDDMICETVHQIPSLKASYKAYQEMSPDDREQFIFDEILTCPLLFWFNQKDMEVELADEVFVVGSSGRF